MRLWHYKLLDVLPRQQLLSQWRECCCIAKSIKEKGTPNHILVNKIMDYDIKEFCYYTYLVAKEMKKRNYKVNINCFEKYFPLCDNINNNILFCNWHNQRYLRQCFYNLQEKYECEGITNDEWNLIESKIFSNDIISYLNKE